MAAQPTESEPLVIFGMDSKMQKPADFYEALLLHLRGDHAGLEHRQRNGRINGSQRPKRQLS